MEGAIPKRSLPKEGSAHETTMRNSLSGRTSAELLQWDINKTSTQKRQRSISIESPFSVTWSGAWSRVGPATQNVNKQLEQLSPSHSSDEVRQFSYSSDEEEGHEVPLSPKLTNMVSPFFQNTEAVETSLPTQGEVHRVDAFKILRVKRPDRAPKRLEFAQMLPQHCSSEDLDKQQPSPKWTNKPTNYTDRLFEKVMELEYELDEERRKNENEKLEHSRHIEKISAELQKLSIEARKGKDWEKQNTQPTKKPKLVSAGPYATRIKEHEYEAGATDDGKIFCKKCLQKGHRTNTCVYISACVYCGGREVMHSSNYHDEVQIKREKAYWKKKAAELEEPRISMNNLE